MSILENSVEKKRCAKTTLIKTHPSLIASMKWWCWRREAVTFSNSSCCCKWLINELLSRAKTKMKVITLVELSASLTIVKFFFMLWADWFFLRSSYMNYFSFAYEFWSLELKKNHNLSTFSLTEQRTFVSGIQIVLLWRKTSTCYRPQFNQITPVTLYRLVSAKWLNTC